MKAKMVAKMNTDVLRQALASAITRELETMPRAQLASLPWFSMAARGLPPAGR